MTALRITDTNSANDTKGRAFGLEGNDFVYVVVGFVIALGLYLLLSVLLGMGKMSSVILALPFFLVPFAWVVLLKHNRPEGYAEDWLEHTFAREGWTFATQTQPSPFPFRRR